MRRKPPPLLCELHAHTRWSDGALSVRELVDVYGRAGFDVLAVTDHTTRRDDPWRPEAAGGARDVHAGTFAAYRSELEAEAARAHALYDLILLPGLELTWNDADPIAAAHVVAVGLASFVSVDGGLEPALAAARADGAALIAAHPYAPDDPRDVLRSTQRFAHERGDLLRAVDRFELFNRHEVFSWVAEERLPVVATGDFHRPEHLASWKTLLPCRKERDAIVGYLRSERPAYLARLGTDASIRIAA